MANLKITLQQIAHELGTEWTGANWQIRSVQTDSRKIQPGDLYVAITGENFDGNDFVDVALAAGAVAAVCKQTGVNRIAVEDTLAALGQIAKLHRATLTAKVIGITGSSGKTSTKDLLAQVLATKAEVIAPAGSFNNEIGLPNTILSATASTEYLVLEMGMRGLGQIQYLAEIAAPEIGVLLNVGSAHLELLKTRANVVKAKGELILALPESGTAVLLADDPEIAALRGQTSAQVITFGEAPSADVRVAEIQLDGNARPEFEISYQGQTATLKLQLAGEHQAINAAAVAAVCLSLGMSFTEVVAGLAQAKPASAMRMQITELPNGITVINDAYNANPESMRAGLKALKAMARGRRTWAVLGEMRELGPLRVEAHDEIGRLCVRLDINRLVAVGTAGKIIQIGAAQEGSWGNEAEWVEDVEQAISKLESELAPGDIVFVKASRAIGLERVADAVIKYFSRENNPS